MAGKGRSRKSSKKIAILCFAEKSPILPEIMANKEWLIIILTLVGDKKLFDRTFHYVLKKKFSCIVEN